MMKSTTVQSTHVNRIRKRILAGHVTETKPQCANRDKSVPELVSCMGERAPGSALVPTAGSPVVDDLGSSLDKLRITQDGACLETRQRWLQQVERETNPHRIAKAQEHWRRASEMIRDRQNGQRPCEEVIPGVRWHQRRARGQIDRFQRVYECGATKQWLVCTQCQAIKECVIECRAPLLCLSCRGRITRNRRAEFHFARNRALERARGCDLLDRSRGGHWTEKLLALTEPHLVEHGVSERIELLFSAWPLLRDSLKKHLAQSAGAHSDLVAWFRSFEWEPGNDGRGHPHFHFWWLSPYISQSLIRQLWRCALATAGFPRSALSHVIVDIRQVRYGKGAALEIIKYLTKDVLPDRQRVASDVFARVYESLEGRRLTQASAKFFKGIERDAKCKCGARGCFRRKSTYPAHAA